MIIIRRQKEFGIRNWLNKSADKDLEKMKQINAYLKDCAIIINDGIFDKLSEEAEKRGCAVTPFRTHKGCTWINRDNFSWLRNQLSREFFNSDPNPIVHYTMSCTEDPEIKSIILVPGESIDSLAHELGHLISSDSNNTLEKFIFQESGKWRLDKEKLKLNNLKNIGKYLIGGVLIQADEWNATRHGLNSLKQVGASKEEIKKARENLSLSRKTYRLATSAEVKKALAKLKLFSLNPLEESNFTEDLLKTIK